MSENLSMASMANNEDLPESAEMRRRQGAIRTALFLLSSSLFPPVLHYLWQAFCC